MALGETGKKLHALFFFFLLFLVLLLSVHPEKLGKVAAWSTSSRCQPGQISPKARNSSFGNEFEVSKHEVPSGPNPDSNR
ncbi:hypothetical protein HPP92_002598 [Vanilla planifolia]|uniref:Uncharacterized protein n=1 Tax=Vanilla planifolia TaxID=51239 RepID=A0A835S5L6_VANPL|nr:hypothetical protein HPP92_002598 [Vanilla planifolia]